MQIKEFSQPVTSKKLNENLAKQFGYQINLEQFSDVQLEDARNKLRTKISQFEVNESFDSVLESPAYQKTRMFLDVVNQEILEREQVAEGSKPDYIDLDKDGDKKEPMKKAAKDKAKKNESYVAGEIRSRAKSESVPDSWIDSAISRMELGESDREELKAELAIRYDINESKAAWMLCEGEEEKAETIMATKDMVDRITGWLEDVAAMKAEQLLELLDAIRETQGSDVAQSYQEAVKPALEAIYTALETSRQGLSNALSIVSGGEPDTMGSAPAGGELGGADLGEPAELPEPEVGGEEPMLPGAETAGRAKRESIDYSRRLGLLLAQSKKK